jgi:hypothetical protein
VHSTAKTWAYGSKHWAYGNRKPPIQVFKKLRGLLQDALPTHENQRVVIDQTTLVDQYIWLHERKAARPLTGFNEIRVRDGPGSTPRDGRNRLGRPRSVRPFGRKVDRGRAPKALWAWGDDGSRGQNAWAGLRQRGGDSPQSKIIPP